MCQPGITEVAKSKDTIVCTESTSGVAIPANTRLKASNLCQCFAAPVQPNERTLYIFLLKPTALSLKVAKSGTKPVYQNNKETVKYVEIANTSQSNGELKLTQSGPLVFGSGAK